MLAGLIGGTGLSVSGSLVPRTGSCLSGQGVSASVPVSSSLSGEGLSSVTSSPDVQQFSTNRQSLPPRSSLRQLTMVFDRSLQSHLEFSEFYQLEVSRPPDPETFTGPARVVASLLASQNPFGGKSRVVVLTACQRDFLWVCRQLWRSS